MYSVYSFFFSFIGLSPTYFFSIVYYPRRILVVSYSWACQIFLNFVRPRLLKTYNYGRFEHDSVVISKTFSRYLARSVRGKGTNTNPNESSSRKRGKLSIFSGNVTTTVLRKRTVADGMNYGFIVLYIAARIVYVVVNHCFWSFSSKVIFFVNFNSTWKPNFQGQNTFYYFSSEWCFFFFVKLYVVLKTTTLIRNFIPEFQRFGILEFLTITGNHVIRRSGRVRIGQSRRDCVSAWWPILTPSLLPVILFSDFNTPR